jgi:hypothetical protein
MRWPGSPSRDLSAAEADCLECRLVGAVTCYGASYYIWLQRAASPHKKFLAGFSAAWFVMGSYRLLIFDDGRGW